MIKYDQIFNFVLKTLVAQQPVHYTLCLRHPKKVFPKLLEELGYQNISSQELIQYVHACTKDKIPDYPWNFKLFWVLSELQEHPKCDFGHKIEPKSNFRFSVDPNTFEIYSTLAKRCNDKSCAQQNEKTRSKTIETCKKKYNGCVNVFQDPAVKAKRMATCKKNYGVEVPAKNQKILDKMHKTCFEYHGVENPWQLQKVKDKLKSEEIRSRRVESLKKHNMNVHGVPWYVMSDEFKAKSKSLGGTSKEEKELVEWLKSITSEKIIVGSYKIICPQQLDVYFPNLKLAFEFNGTYFHSLEHNSRNLNYHLDKTKKCESLSIKLVHIWEDEWIFKKDETKDFLRSLVDGTFVLDATQDVFEVDRSKFNLCWTPIGYHLKAEIEPEVVLRDNRPLDKYRVPNCGKLVFERDK